jgi:excisionase family DNA binding protein
MVETVKNRLIGLEDAARYLGVCERHLRKIIKDGKIKFVDLGTKKRPAYRFRPSDIDEFIDRRTMICQPKQSQASLKEVKTGTTISNYKVIDFAALHASVTVAKPKGGSKILRNRD